jgi:hypothetical protein
LKKRKDVLGTLLEQYGVLKYISNNANDLGETFFAIRDTFKHLFPDETVTQSEAICPIFWFYIRWASPIQDLILQHFDENDFWQYGGIVSLRVVKEIMKKLDIDMGIVKVNYLAKQNGKGNKPK